MGSTGWCHDSHSNCGHCGGTFDPRGAKPKCGSEPAPIASTPGGGCCKWGAHCADCGSDSTGWCHDSHSNCGHCGGTFDPTGAKPICGGGSFLQQRSESDSPHTIRRHRFLASSFVQVDACS